jgi:hypothetical protein
MRHTKIIFMLLLLNLGCVPGGISIDDEETTDSDDEVGTTSDTSAETGSASTEWTDIRCIDVDGSPLCLGRLDSGEAWSFVILECALEELLVANPDAEVPTWGASTCADGLAPSTDGWDAVRCFEGATIGTVCYGITGGWATALLPPCMIEQGPVPPWPSPVCQGGAPQLGTHPFDDAWCIDSPDGSCFGEISGGLTMIKPTCWIDERNPSIIPECPSSDDTTDSTDTGACAGSLGCECMPDSTCEENLECVGGLCHSCPVGQLGCECAPDYGCDIGLMCVAGTCKFN